MVKLPRHSKVWHALKPYKQFVESHSTLTVQTCVWFDQSTWYEWVDTQTSCLRHRQLAEDTGNSLKTQATCCTSNISSSLVKLLPHDADDWPKHKGLEGRDPQVTLSVSSSWTAHTVPSSNFADKHLLFCCYLFIVMYTKPTDNTGPTISCILKYTKTWLHQLPHGVPI